MIKRTLIVTISLLLAGVGLAEISLRSSLSSFHDVRPGDVVDGTIAVENVGDSAAVVRIYQTDYSFQSDGQKEYAAAGSSARSNADWISLEHSQISIPVGGWEEIDYRITVPFGDLSGSYWSVVMIEEVRSQANESDEFVSVQTVVRYGVQLVTELAGTAESYVEFDRPLLEQSHDDYLLSLDIVNTGERLVRADYHLELYDSRGTQVVRVAGEPKRVYPGSSIRQRFSLGSVAPGEYTALILADPGDDEVFAAQYQLSIGGP